LARVSERGVADLVERIGRVGNELSQEDLLVRVEGVDDQVEKLGNLGLTRSATVLQSPMKKANPDDPAGLVPREIPREKQPTWKPKVSVWPLMLG
jgi:hypothetical protein